MDNTIPQLLNQVTAVQLVVAVLAIVTVATICYVNWNKISDKLYAVFRNKEEAQMVKKNVKKLQEETEDIRKQIGEYDAIRIKDRMDAITIRNQLNEDVQTLSSNMNMLIETVSNLAESVSDMSHDIKHMQKETAEIREKNKKSKRTDIKSKIERLYTECSPIQTCTDMQFETLKDLIEDYETHGGDNSFVHSIVQKEMYKWKRQNTYK